MVVAPEFAFFMEIDKFSTKLSMPIITISEYCHFLKALLLCL
jgi:hypothetical protein